MKQDIYNFILRTNALSILVLMLSIPITTYFPRFIIDIFSPKVRRIFVDCVNPILLILIITLCFCVNIWCR